MYRTPGRQHADSEQSERGAQRVLCLPDALCQHAAHRRCSAHVHALVLCTRCTQAAQTTPVLLREMALLLSCSFAAATCQQTPSAHPKCTSHQRVRGLPAQTASLGPAVRPQGRLLCLPLLLQQTALRCQPGAAGVTQSQAQTPAAVWSNNKVKQCPANLTALSSNSGRGDSKPNANTSSSQWYCNKAELFHLCLQGCMTCSIGARSCMRMQAQRAPS